MCHIIVALHYVHAEEREFSTLNETQRVLLCFALSDVLGKDKNPFLLSQVGSIAVIFVISCIKDWTMISPSSTLRLQGWLSKKRILLKQWRGQMYPLIGCLNFHVPITWLIWGHSWSIISNHKIFIVLLLLKQCCTNKNCTWVLVLSNNIRLFSWFKVCREEKLYLRCLACSLVPGLTARERTTYWNLREVYCWC